MKAPVSILLMTASLILAGCQTRSISDAGYERDYNYRGELSELAVLGVDSDKPVTEEEIAQALARSSTVGLKHGDAVVLVQSGAAFPDDQMLNGLQKDYHVIPLSGVPVNGALVNQQYPRYWGYNSEPKQEETKTPPLDMALRLAAAKGGARYLIVYWGQLEITQDPYASKAISWVPIVGGVVPDEMQQMRIRLKIAVIDVETGDWNMIMPTVYEDKTNTASYTRGFQHNDQVALLKSQAYAQAVKDISTRYN